MVKSKKTNSEEERDISLGNMLGGKISFPDIDEILQRKVIKFGNSGRVNIPAKHIGKDVQITVWNNDIEHVGFDNKGNKVYRKRLDNKQLRKEGGDKK